MAISNRRLLDSFDNTVRFSYKDYEGQRKGGDLKKVMTLPAKEFIRRFLLHILPKGFNKIRFYGFWAGKVKKDILKRVRCEMAEETQYEPDEECEENSYTCPRCKVVMFYRMLLEPQYSRVAYADTS